MSPGCGLRYAVPPYLPSKEPDCSQHAGLTPCSVLNPTGPEIHSCKALRCFALHFYIAFSTGSLMVSATALAEIVGLHPGSLLFLSQLLEVQALVQEVLHIAAVGAVSFGFVHSLLVI